MTTVAEDSAGANGSTHRIAGWLRFFVTANQVVELRGLKKTGGADSRIFQSVDALAACAASGDASGIYRGIYFTPNPLNPDLVHRQNSACAADVLSRRWLLIDFDPIRETATNATDQERADAWEALDMVRANLEGPCGLKGPVVCDSGNGWHLCYPVQLPNDDATHTLVKNVLAGLGSLLPEWVREKVKIDTAVHDAPRIWKLPGTTARKGPYTDERPHRIAQLIEEMSMPWTAENAMANSSKLAGIIERCQQIHERTSRYRQIHERTSRGDAAAWAQAALRQEVEAVANAPPQGWNTQLNTSAFNLGQLVPKYLDEATVVAALTDASARRNHQGQEVAATIHSGLESGRGQPREYPGESRGPAAGATCRAVTICLSDVQPTPVLWTWDRRFPRGAYSSLDGDPGLGKTLQLLELAARRSRGQMMPGETQMRPPSNSLILTSEDSLNQTIRPRLDAAEADLSRIFCLQGIQTGTGERPIFLPDDLPFIEHEIVEKDIEQVLFDPTPAFFGEDVDSHNEASVRRVMHAIKIIAEKTGAAFIGNRHLNKASNVSDPLYRGTGSIAITAAARSVMLVARHPDEDGKFVLARTKGNLSAAPESLAYQIVERGGSIAIEWLGTTELNANDLLVRSRRQDAEQRNDAAVRAAGTALLNALDTNDPNREGIGSAVLQKLARISDRDFVCAVAQLVRQETIEKFEMMYRCGRGHGTERVKEGIRRRQRQS
jgi:hypothetical protein